MELLSNSLAAFAHIRGEGRPGGTVSVHHNPGSPPLPAAHSVLSLDA